MKVLFYSSYHVTPHIETELEIAQKLKEEGHDLYFLQCKGELGACFANPEHDYLGCKICISRVSNAYDRLQIPQKNRLTFPAVTPDLSSIPYHHLKDMEELKKLTYKGWDIGMALASSIVSYTRDHHPDLHTYKWYIEAGIKTAVLVYEATSRILDDLRPDVVYLFNGRFVEVRPLMRACEERDIIYFTHERGSTLHKYMLREREIPHSIEFAKTEIVELWGEGGKEKEDIGSKFYTDRRNRVIQNWHSFTAEQQLKKLPANFDNSRENIVIFNSSIDEYEGVAGFENPFYTDDNEGIDKIVEAFHNDPSKHFYLRVHPSLRGLRNTQVKEIEGFAKKHPNLTVIPAEEDIDTYELMDKADKVLTFSSTMGMESVFWKRPVILLSRAYYEDLDCFYKPTSKEHLIELINDKTLVPFNQYESLKYGYWCMNYGIDHRHYQAASVTKGTFDNKPILPNFFWRSLFILQNKLKNVKA